MAYAAVRGGKKTAIDEAARLVEYFRLKGGSSPIEVRQIREQMRAAVDRVMGEGSLYAPDLAALALKQAEGDTLEASFLLRLIVPRCPATFILCRSILRKCRSSAGFPPLSRMCRAGSIWALRVTIRNGCSILN